VAYDPLDHPAPMVDEVDYEEDYVATATRKTAQPAFGAENQGESIVISTVVDIIHPSRDGTESMVAAAFLRMGQYISENFDGNGPLELGFDYGGQHFVAMAGMER